MPSARRSTVFSMPAERPSDDDPGSVDARAVRRHFARAAATYDAAAVLQREVGRRMAEKLDVVKLAPAAILDAGCGTGDAQADLALRYPDARQVALDVALPMLARGAGRKARRATLRVLAPPLRAVGRRARRCRLCLRRHRPPAVRRRSVRSRVEQPRAAMGGRLAAGAGRARPRAARQAGSSRSRRSVPTRCASCAPPSPASTGTAT